MTSHPTNSTHYVIGMGEVGTALTNVLDCPGRDLLPPDTETDPDFLHIAYPWSEDFIRYTVDYQDHYQPSVVVVHSTVPVGTCDTYGWVHSPVRGRHPDLARDLTVFRKPFGGPDAKKAIHAAMSWPGQAVVFPSASATEAGKLWELAQFGLQVRVTQAIYEWCEENGLSGDQVYKIFASDYNAGYSELAPQFIRPILEYVSGEIGGHCVVSGTQLLDHEIAQIVKEGWK